MADPVGGTSALPADIREGIAIANAKSIGEQSSLLSNLAYSNELQNTNLSQQNAIQFQQAMNQVGMTVTGNAVNRIADLSPMEAVATAKIFAGTDVAQQLVETETVNEAS